MRKIKEDVAYGIYDRPGPGMEDEPAPQEPPIVAGPQMSIQLSTEKPPIDDEEYSPTSISALSLAASEIANHVPEDQIEFFYKALHRILNKATDRTAIIEEEPHMQEESLKKEIQSALLEIISKDEEQEFEEFRKGKDYESDGVDYFGDSPPEADVDPEASAAGDKSNLEDLAKEFGFSGASGARQYIQRILKRLGFSADVLDDAAIESLTGIAVPEYIASMQEGDYIDAEDVADLKNAPGIVRGLASFQYFFVSGFILPAYREFSRTVNNSVRKSIDDAGIPKSLHDTVFNQATGLAAKDPQAIKQKLRKSVKSGELSAGDLSDIFNTIRDIAYGTSSEKPGAEDFVSSAVEKWQGLSRSRRQGVLKKALNQTIEESE